MPRASRFHAGFWKTALIWPSNFFRKGKGRRCVAPDLNGTEITRFNDYLACKKTQAITESLSLGNEGVFASL